MQRNLITEGGELASEVARMKTLNSRVIRRLEESSRNIPGIVDDDGAGKEKVEPGWADAAQKMEGILGLS